MCDKPKHIVEDGIEYKLCLKCGEYWPETAEYFCYNNHGNLASPCRACRVEQLYTTNRVKGCSYPGCTKPRYDVRYTRCYEHRRYAVVEAQYHKSRLIVNH